MPLLYEIPAHFQVLMNSQQASLIGAIIKDNTTGQILGHVQQASGLAQTLNSVVGPVVSTGFSPLSAVSVIQNYQINRGIEKLSEGMVLMQNLQYGTLALSGLGLGVSIAGFAATLIKLQGIERQIEVLSASIAQVTEDRREDELRSLLATLSADLQTLDTVYERRDPAAVAEQLQMALSRTARNLERHFYDLSTLQGKTSLSLDVVDRLWALAAAIRICQDASIQALFAANELDAAASLAQAELKKQMALMNAFTPDAMSRMIARSEPDPQLAFETRNTALPKVKALVNGLKGGVESLAGQVSIAQTLATQKMSGLDYLREARGATDARLMCLTPPREKTKLSWRYFTSRV